MVRRYPHVAGSSTSALSLTLVHRSCCHSSAPPRISSSNRLLRCTALPRDTTLSRMLSCYALACSIVLCSPSLHASYTRLPSRHYVCLEWSSHFSGSPALVACVPLNSNAHSPSSPPLSGATLRYRSRPRSTCTLHVMTPRGYSRTVSLPTAVYPRGQSTWYVVPVLLQLRHRYVPTTPRQPSVSVTALLFGHSLSPRYHLLTAASLISIQQRLSHRCASPC